LAAVNLVALFYAVASEHLCGFNGSTGPGIQHRRPIGASELSATVHLRERSRATAHRGLQVLSVFVGSFQFDPCNDSILGLNYTPVIALLETVFKVTR
jgi:hypothetical protein